MRTFPLFLFASSLLVSMTAARTPIHTHTYASMPPPTRPEDTRTHTHAHTHTHQYNPPDPAELTPAPQCAAPSDFGTGAIITCVIFAFTRKHSYSPKNMLPYPRPHVPKAYKSTRAHAHPPTHTHSQQPTRPRRVDARSPVRRPLGFRHGGHHHVRDFGVHDHCGHGGRWVLWVEGGQEVGGEQARI